ncbi:MAG: signal peptidase I [Myxococcota bacterium]|jgi:signal peptidase I|nr:signal peptidase I [Myxococcota bacterium]
MSAPPYDHETDDDRGAGQRFMDWCRDLGRSWGPALLIVLLIRSVFAEPFRIPSGSMVPTLEIGDHILVTKYSYGLRIPLTRIPLTNLQVPERGDVVVFVYPGSDEDRLAQYLDLPVPPFATLDYVKRVVGLPGDTLEVRSNVLYINGEKQTQQMLEPYEFVDDRCRSSASRLIDEQLGVDDEAAVNHSILTAVRYGLRMGDFGPTTVPEDHVFAMGDNRDHSSDSRVWGFVPLRNIKGKARFVWLSYDQCEPGMPIFGTFRDGRFGTPLE